MSLLRPRVRDDQSGTICSPPIGLWRLTAAVAVAVLALMCAAVPLFLPDTTWSMTFGGLCAAWVLLWLLARLLRNRVYDARGRIRFVPAYYLPAGDRWWGPWRFRRAGGLALMMLKDRICPSCRYNLDGTSPESDGCTVCPECGAAWRLRE